MLTATPLILVIHCLLYQKSLQALCQLRLLMAPASYHCHTR
jgi:hypothetical protein